MEEIKRLIEKRGRYSKAEIDYIVAEGEKWGVKPPTNTRCSNCWKDMAIEIAYNMRKDKPKKHALRGDAARDGVIFKGRLICEANVEDNWEWMMQNGFPKQLLQDED